MITSAFDLSEPIIKVEDIYKIESFNCDTCIVSFSRKIKEEVVNQYKMQKVGEVSYANGISDIYVFEYNGKLMLYYLSPIGAAISSAILYEVSYKFSVKNFIVFGSCGVLNKDVFGKLIVPTESYRDEGLSYHYMAPSDYITMNNAKKVEEIFKEIGASYAAGRNWCTDAIYMETINKVNARMAEGCNTVEMESSGMQALCNYAGLNLYMFFFTSDLVSIEGWENDCLGTDKEKTHQKNSFEIALEIGVRV